MFVAKCNSFSCFYDILKNIMVQMLHINRKDVPLQRKQKRKHI